MEQLGHLLLTLSYMAVIPGVLAAALLPTIFASMRERPADLVSIKVRFEGLTGVAGPNMKVISITRVGTQLASRSQPPARKYEVVLNRPDGSELREMIGVSAGILDNGNLVPVSGSRRRF